MSYVEAKKYCAPKGRFAVIGIVQDLEDAVLMHPHFVDSDAAIEEAKDIVWGFKEINPSLIQKREYFLLVKVVDENGTAICSIKPTWQITMSDIVQQITEGSMKME